MWTTANRPKYNRDKLRYPSDLTGEEWAHIEALEVVNGIMYVLSTGCQWRYVPKDLPPKSTLSIISTCGPTTARWRLSIMRFM